MGKTKIRKELDKEIASKLLLNEASTFQIVKSVYKRHKHGINYVVVLIVGVLAGRFV